ncbi:MAG: EAL domain-containing protein [Actinomycetota bacterium]|nr:EAL domain-containing protein [Actinomycetota bacterium]
MAGVPVGRVPEDLVEAAHRVIDARSLRSIFQPLVHLATDEVVGYEALSRGPAGSPLEQPLNLLAAAKAAGRLDELDWLCAASACQAAVGARLHASMSIFLNFEPTTLLTTCPQDLLPHVRRALDHLRVVVEMKEDSLLADPGGTLDALTQAREIGWGVAIDDATATPASMALFPLVHPDVIKLDLRGALDDLDRIAGMGDAARLYAERTGATILAQGLEGPDDLLLARTTGATFGQGYYYGRPDELEKGGRVPRTVFPLLPAPTLEVAATPFQVIAARCEVAVTETRLLLPLCRHLEEQVDANGPKGVLLCTFLRGTRFTSRLRTRLAQLMERSAFTVLLGTGLARDDGPGWRAYDVRHDDPIGDEWSVIVLGPHYAGALVAREAPLDGSQDQDRLLFALTHDRDLILEAARGLLGRVRARRPTPA